MSETWWAFGAALALLVVLACVIPRRNVLVVGATRQGKTQSAAKSIVEGDEACLVLDFHERSLAWTVVEHFEGNLLYDRLSDLALTLGFDFLAPSTRASPLERLQENQQRAEAFTEVLLRRRSDGLGALMDEWISALTAIFLSQVVPKPLTMLPYGFLPGTPEFEALVSGTGSAELREKFRQLAKMTPRALRSEVGSAHRLIQGVFRSAAWQARCGRAFPLGPFFEDMGVLVLERGEAGEDASRVLMGGVVLQVIDWAKRRTGPFPPARVVIDEANNAGLVGRPEIKGIAELAKQGLFFTFLVQNLDFPGGPDAVLQNCTRHEWFGCAHYDLARKAATDVAAGLDRGEETRAELIARLTDDIMGLPPGWRWVRDPSGSRKEYCPLLESRWPPWQGLREGLLEEKLRCMRSRREYRMPDIRDAGGPDTESAASSSPVTPPPASSSAGGSSPAERWRRSAKKRPDGS